VTVLPRTTHLPLSGPYVCFARPCSHPTNVADANIAPNTISNTLPMQSHVSVGGVILRWLSDEEASRWLELSHWFHHGRSSWGRDQAPSGPLSGGLARVNEGRTNKENHNHNRVYFKCPRNGVNSIVHTILN